MSTTYMKRREFIKNVSIAAAGCALVGAAALPKKKLTSHKWFSYYVPNDKSTYIGLQLYFDDGSTEVRTEFRDHEIIVRAV